MRASSVTEGRRAKWRMYAFLARHGHQQVTTLLGRTPSVVELKLFAEELVLLIEKEPPAIRLG